MMRRGTEITLQFLCVALCSAVVFMSEHVAAQEATQDKAGRRATKPQPAQRVQPAFAQVEEQPGLAASLVDR